jgi:uncharacterized protein (TIGR02453 family)
MAFNGFPQNALPFLQNLGANNNRDWFEEHRKTYEADVKGPMVQLIAALVTEFHVQGIPLTADPQKAIMRINRDVRFSKDKSPYKTSIAATMTRTGERHAQGLLYLHIEPGDSFMAAGFYELAPPELAAMRKAIVADADAWQQLESQLSGTGIVLQRDGALVKTPKGFSNELPDDVTAALRLKSFVVKQALSTTELHSSQLPGHIAQWTLKILPLLDFGWDALGVSAEMA